MPQRSQSAAPAHHRSRKSRPLRLPSLLVPFPAAADNHQYFNALAFEKSGAAKLLEQKHSTPEKVSAILTELVRERSGPIKNTIRPGAMARAKRGRTNRRKYFARIRVCRFFRGKCPGGRSAAARLRPRRARANFPPHDRNRNHFRNANAKRI